MAKARYHSSRGVRNSSANASRRAKAKQVRVERRAKWLIYYAANDEFLTIDYDGDSEAEARAAYLRTCGRSRLPRRSVVFRDTKPERENLLT